MGRNRQPSPAGARARWREHLHQQTTELLREGLIELAGHDEAGDPIFRVTAAGALEAGKAVEDWEQRRGGS